MRVLRSPLVHFVAIGAALFAGSRWLDPPEPEPLVVPATERERLVGELRRSLGRDPSGAELEYALSSWVDDELLVRHARTLGWHRTDPVVQMRLVRNLRFVSDDPEAEPDNLLEQAYALEMDRTDLVVRRRLAERMRLAIMAPVRESEPSDAELQELLERDAHELRRPALVQVTQLFLSRDRRGDRLRTDADALLETLIREGVSPAAGTERGDPFLVPARLPLSTERGLAARFGPEFARETIRASNGRWSGPIASAYGMHLVWVHRRVGARDPGLEEVRPELLARWRSEREREVLRLALGRLRSDADLPQRPAPGD